MIHSLQQFCLSDGSIFSPQPGDAVDGLALFVALLLLRRTWRK